MFEQKLFSTKNFFDQKISDQKFFRQEFFRTQKLFQILKFFWDKIFFGTENFFRLQILFVPNFFPFISQIIKELTLFPFFGIKNFFILSFFDPNFFRPKIIVPTQVK